jgi:hypothetical protein
VLVLYFYLCGEYIAHETPLCRDPRPSSYWNSRITRQSVYKHTFCESVVSKKQLLVLIFS